MVNPTSYKCIHSFEFENIIYDVFSQKTLEGSQHRNLVKRVETSFREHIRRMYDWMHNGRKHDPDQALSIKLKSGDLFFIKRSPPLVPLCPSLQARVVAGVGELRYLGH